MINQRAGRQRLHGQQRGNSFKGGDQVSRRDESTQKSRIIGGEPAVKPDFTERLEKKNERIKTAKKEQGVVGGKGG